MYLVVVVIHNIIGIFVRSNNSQPSSVYVWYETNFSSSIKLNTFPQLHTVIYNISRMEKWHQASLMLCYISTGSIPQDIGSLKMLQILNLGTNNLTGVI